MTKISESGVKRRLTLKQRLAIQKNWRLRNKDKISAASKIYRRKHQKRIRENWVRYLAQNREAIKYTKRLYRIRNRDRIQHYAKTHKLERQLNYHKWRDSLVGRLKLRLNKCRKRPSCTLTIANLLVLWKQQKGRCALVGRTMTYTNGLQSVSVDRIDNNQSYTPDNVRLVCWWANKARNSWGDKEFYKWCRLVLGHS